MYDAGPQAAAAWRALFTRVFSDLGLAIEIVEHKWPQPIEMLWNEANLCCAFMCGWPFTRAGQMQPIAVPIPSPPRYEGLPRYCSEFLVREESGWTQLEQAFAHRIGWMSRNSHSGFNAPRAHLARFATTRRPRLFAESVGPLGSPAAAIDALMNAQVDVIAIDSFYLDLVRRHRPEKLAGVRTVATTDWAPMPLLVAAPSIDAAIVKKLRAHLTKLHDDPSYAPLLEPVLLLGFAVPAVLSYWQLSRAADEAAASGYADIR
jgi:ABC-type phosphate/phosphonate transport system substrate-binding protein